MTKTIDTNEEIEEMVRLEINCLLYDSKLIVCYMTTTIASGRRRCSGERGSEASE